MISCVEEEVLLSRQESRERQRKTGFCAMIMAVSPNADRLKAQMDLLDTVPHCAKFGGATGNLNAHR